jgi:flavin reductase (DIM6/NTAB) family NADH-FMN oxidoreductase RutF
MTALATIDQCKRPANGGLVFADADIDAYRAATRQFAGGVCLVTHAAGGICAGMTATAVASLSVDPPTLIVCVNRGASTYVGLTRGAAFGVSVLSADHIDLAERFADRAGDKGVDRFRDGRWLIAPNGAPLLSDALAAFECEVDDLVERHTHAIVIGRVLSAAASSGGGALVHWRGRFDQLGWTLDELLRATGRSPTSAGR